MKIAVIIVRYLMAALFLFSAAVFFFKLMPTPEMTGDLKLFMVGFAASGYLLPLIKITEVLCALAFISGRYVALAAVVIFPVTVNILLVHVFISPEGIPVGVFLFLGNLLLAYHYRTKYAPMLDPK